MRERMKCLFRELWLYIRFGKITSEITDTAGYDVAAEIVYYGRGHKVIGFWAYGYFDPKYPYQGN